MKPSAHIEDWEVIDTIHGKCLIGTITKHDRQEEFKSNFQKTSPLVAFDEANSWAETRNTNYTLGKKI